MVEKEKSKKRGPINLEKLASTMYSLSSSGITC